MVLDNYAFGRKSFVGVILGGFFSFLSVFIIGISAKKRGREYKMICLDLFLMIGDCTDLNL